MKLDDRKPFTCYLLIVLHFLLGIGALFGGGALMLSPDGSLMRMPLNFLQNTPFSNFLFPGLILFVGLGVLPVITAIFLISERPLKAVEKLCIDQARHWSWNSSLYIGFILIIWITVEVYMIKVIAFIHVIYIFLGLFIQAITLLPSVKNHYLNTKKC